MFVKTSILLLMVLTTLFAQTRVTISGTVQNSRTKEFVKDANIKMTFLKLTTNTDTNGYFEISGTPIRQSWKTGKKEIPVVDGKNLSYWHENGSALIRIFDLSGKQHATIFSGALASGFWRIIPPKLLPGVYLCTFDTPQSRFTVSFLSHDEGTGVSKGTLKKIINGSNESITATAKSKIAVIAIDSLIVEKNGYRSAHIPVDNYNQTGMNIQLDDTSTSNNSVVTIIPDPSWTCYMPDGIPPPELGEAVFNIKLQYSAVHDVGITQFGHRYQYDIKEGNLTGERIKGTAVTGGLDYELTLSNGSIELEQIVILRASDNTPILMRNAGVAPAGDKSVRVVLDFEAPNSSSHTWLNTGKFAAVRIVDTAAKTIKLDVYDISKVVLTENRIKIKDPENAPNQTWECVKLTGSKGTTVFTENVSLGSSISIGASKRGSRNIIPITGGTTSGRVTGKILSGGADYQLSGLDARYTLAPDDGELIIVRNCGSMGALIPVFETRTDGPYAFLNENKYLSSDPGMGGGGVKITFYESK